MTRRTLLFAGGVAAGALSARKFSVEDIGSGQSFPSVQTQSAETILNDASLLSPTPIAKHVVLSSSPDEAMISVVRAEIAEAKAFGRPFSASAARHSMGGQSLPNHGTALTFEQKWIEHDTANGIFRVAAGMRWIDVIAALDTIGFSPKVMQSNSDFGIASTFSVNAHGWPVPFSAFGSTVKSLRLMRHDGEVVRCSRDENSDQFKLAMGGYGLIGAIIDLDVEMVKNTRLQPKFETMNAREFGNRFVAALKQDPTIQMAYGRMDVTIGSFFEEALMITYRPIDDQSNLPKVEGSGFVSKVSRDIFRAQLDSDRGKSFRWFVETEVGPRIGNVSTRNSLMNEPVVTLDDHDPKRTDILHEYFVAPERFAEFVDACRDVIRSSYQQLLNVTLRFVDTDQDAVLAYATVPRIAAVMLFSQEMSVRGEADMAHMTSSLIERVIAIGGTYYLPYRLHATDDQFQRGYPQSASFAAQKRVLDPDLVFRNALWDRYLAKIG